MQLITFHKTNFALYSIYKRRIWAKLIRLLAFASIYLLMGTVMYKYVIVPSQRIVHYSHMNNLLQQRIDFLNKKQQEIEVKRKYIDSYYAMVDKHKFSKMWSIIWPTLSKHLPNTAWIKHISWEKEHANSYAMHLYMGIEKTGNKHLRQVNEFIRGLKESPIMDYFSDIQLVEAEQKQNDYVYMFHMVFIPKKEITIEI